MKTIFCRKSGSGLVISVENYLGDCVSRMRTHVAYVAICVGFIVLMTAAHAQVPGSLDLSFGGSSGKVTNLAIGAGDDNASSLAIQSDGKLVIAGSCSNGSKFDFCVARLNKDGTLDESFDGPSGSGNGAFLLPIGTGDAVANALAIQSDGKIVLAGACMDGSDTDFCVARLNVDGSLDASFDGPLGNGNGRFLLTIWTANRAIALVIQPDGRLVIAGQCSSGVNFDFCVARLNTDGTLDASFTGPSGTSNGAFLLQIGTGYVGATGLAIQTDGKLVLSGLCINNVTNNYDFCVARLNVDGSLDANFDGPSGNGVVLLSIGTNNDFAFALAIQPDGKIVLAGYCDGTFDREFCVARLNTDGSLDTSFDGPQGGGNGAFLLPMGTTSDSAWALAIQPDGKLVIAGECLNGIGYEFCVARLHADGSLDASFDGPSGSGNGQFRLSIASSQDRAFALAIQPDGKIVLAGHCFNGGDSDFCVARLNGGPFGAKQCSLDIDGDNVVLASTDMLISTRVALGLRGNAVIDGVSFAPHATRNTWPLIRRFLVAQCGMRLQ
ncbi:MAG: hypothetical protein ACRCWJ_00020 [Casimicrobium sp.]